MRTRFRSVPVRACARARYPLVSRAAKDPMGERNADLTEYLDPSEEAQEQERDSDQLAQLEELGRAEARQRVGAADDQCACRDEQRCRTRLWIVPFKSARIAPGNEAKKFTVMATGAMIRLNTNESPDWPASSE